MRIGLVLLVGLALAADGGLASEGQTMRSPNLARLAEKVPGAARALAWTKGGKQVEAPSLADGNRKAAAKLPPDWSAVGVAWAVPHVADRGEVFFAEAAPPPASLVLQAFDGEGWVRVRDGLKAEPRPGARAIRYTFEPVATAAMRLQAKGAPPAVCELEIHPYTPGRPGGRITWPKRMAGRELEEQILARRQEPSFESLSLYGLSMPVWATMGIKDWPHEQAVSWDGRILVPLFKIAAGVGDPPRGFADVRDTVRRNLIDGWLPGVVVEGQFGDVALKQTSFVAFIDPAGKKPGLFLSFDVRNVSKRPCKTSLTVRLDWDDGKTQLTFRDGALVRGKATYLVCGGPCRAGAARNAIAWDVTLPAGGAHTFTAAAPVNYDGRTPISSHLRGAGYDEALASFRGYWRKLLAPAMKLDLPEKRLNNLYRSVLTQIYINADGDVMPYGSMPSAYDGALYGVEEGYAMMALAMSGLGRDAQRYMDRTYLHKRFLRKVEKYGGYGDRHQQYRNGLQPMYAVAAYRITGDRRWITGHLPLLAECAEWTIATRRKTMKEEGGKKPLHWGLLPKWSYGGDIADRQCYPLYANIACWRGLHDTAWLMERLGRHKAAGRLAKEAHEYRKVIGQVIDKIYRADAKPPFLPPHVYATGPEGGRIVHGGIVHKDARGDGQGGFTAGKACTPRGDSTHDRESLDSGLDIQRAAEEDSTLLLGIDRHAARLTSFAPETDSRSHHNVMLVVGP